LQTGALDLVDSLGNIKGFRQILECPAMVGRDRAVQIGVRGHDDHGQLRVSLVHALKQFQAIHAGHADIRDDDVRHLPAQPGEGILRIVKAAGFHSTLAECLFQHPANRVVVINDPDAANFVHLYSTGR